MANIQKYHRLEKRCVLRHISNMNFHPWAVLGSQGCREKNIQTAISMLLLRAVFLCVHWQKICKKNLKYCSVRTKKLHCIKVKKVLKFCEVFYFYFFMGCSGISKFKVITSIAGTSLCYLFCASHIIYQLKNKWKKCKGLSLNVFHLKETNVIHPEKLKKSKSWEPF